MKKLSARQKKEFYRKSIHLGSLILPFSYYFVFGFQKAPALLVFFPLALISFIFDLVRLEHKSFKKVFYRFFGIMLRKHEISNFTGASYLLTSTVFCIALFPANIAFTALVYLSIGDTLAALFGLTFGKRNIKKTHKSLEGSLACFSSCFIFSLLMSFHPEMGLHPLVGLFGSYAATLAELFRFPIDDNIKIPIFAGFIMSLAGILV